MNKSRLFVVMFCLAICIQCKSKQDQPISVNMDIGEVSLPDVKKKTSEKSVKKEVLSIYNGFYLNSFNASGVLYFYNGKLVHFNRNEPTSFYKDEEYDIDDLNEEGFFFINRTYRIDRHEKLVSKETVLYDTRPETLDGVCISLKRNGRTFERMNSFTQFINSINYNSSEQLIKSVHEKYGHSEEIIKKAMEDIHFYAKAGLEEVSLRGGDVEFVDIVNNIIIKSK